MIYRHRFQVRAPLARVSKFHSRAASMAAITPPPIIIRMNQSPATLAEGDRMDFTMWLGPLAISWLARMEGVSNNGFTDRQLRGPFEEWVHRHSFLAVDEETTEIVDEITLQPRRQPFWWLMGMGMWLGLPLLFTYRAWKTRRMLK
jgi:ligand-binding SRPBCC domain-containing protein